MRALVFHGSKKVSVDQQPDPTIEQSTDVLLKVTSTAICGSDLHIYNGFFPQPKPLVLGHEFMGIVEEVGASVTKWKRGDRVVVPFRIACGACWFCSHAMPTQCEKSNAEHYGPEGALLAQKGGALFGYTDLYGGYAGGQAEYVRVPFADVGPRRVPDELSDDQALFLSDICPTAYAGLRWAEVQHGETVAVFGCGPVGLMAQKLALAMGASKVIGVDILPYRLETAKRTAQSIPINAVEHDPVEQIRALTHGRGVDVAIDAIGMEVDRSVAEKVSNVLHGQAGSKQTVDRCVSAVRRGGRVSILGVYGTKYDNFPLGQMVDKGLRVQAGQAPVHNFIDELLAMVVEGRVRLDDIISHRLPLTEAPRAYQMFNDKEDRCVKVVLKPWS